MQIPASKLAACIGMHPYNTVQQGVAAAACKIAGIRGPKKQETLKSVMAMPAVTRVLREVALPSESVSETIDRLAILATGDKRGELATVHECIQEHARGASERDRAILMAASHELEAVARMHAGIKSEHADLNKAEKMIGLVTSRNSKLYSQVLVPGLELVGRVDGLDEQGRVVEAKHRRNRLFNEVVQYELVQVYAYMFLTGATEAVLVESFQGDQRAHNIALDAAFLTDIKTRALALQELLLVVTNDRAYLERAHNYCLNPISDAAFPEWATQRYPCEAIGHA